MAEPGGLTPLPAVDVLDLLAPERAALCDLLTALEPDEWTRPTECPAWNVHGVALHVLGDDLSLLSRQRDAAVPSLLTEGMRPSWDGAPENLLDRFNERWVHAATYLSPALLVELLDWTGEQSRAWYTTVDPDTTGEPVLLFGMRTAPYRWIAAREYVERWVHHLQIRRALGLDAGSLGAAPYAPRAVDVIARAMATLVALASPPTDATVTIGFGETAYSYRCRPDAQPLVAHDWVPLRGADPDATVTVTIDAAVVVALLSRGLARPEAAAALTVGAADPDLGARLVDAMAATTSAYYADL